MTTPVVPKAVLDVERRRIRARMRRLAVDHRALRQAVEEHFGSDFDEARWQAAFDSDEPSDVNMVAAVVSAFERIVNGLVETARSGLTAGGLARPGRSPDTVPADLATVRDNRGLSGGQYDLLVALSRTRNELQHDYVEVSAPDARDAIRRLRHNLGSVTKALNAWLHRYGVGVGPGE